MQNQTLKGFRISAQQRRLWGLQQDSPVYCAQCAIRLEGALDLQRLKTAMECVVTRHEILRTTLYRPAGMTVPFQVIADRHVPLWRDMDLSDVGAEDQEVQIDALLLEESRRPFDFEHGPLLRLVLLTLSEHKHVLLVSLPSLCADTWALHNLVREMAHFYGADLQSETPLAEPLQYADFAEWQHELLETDDVDSESGKAYWSKQNLAAFPALELPLEGAPNGEVGFAPESHPLHLDADVVAGIEAVSQRYDTSLAVFLLSCWQTLLWRLTGVADILVGNVCDGRRDTDLHDAIGVFAKWLPLTCRFVEDFPFSEILWQVNEAVRDGYEWHDYCDWEERLGSNSDGASAPIGFEYTESPVAHHVKGVTVSVYQQHSFLNRFKILLSCARAGDALTAVLHYDPALFQRDDITRLARCYVALLQSAAQEPETPVHTLDILSAQDRHQQLVAFNDTATAYPHDICMHELFETQVTRTPDDIAVVCEDRRMTYAELNARANQLAHYLRRHGVGADVRVGLCVDRSVEMLIGLMGILKAGGAYVPLNPEYPQARLAQQLAEIHAPVVLTQEKHIRQLPIFDGEWVCLDRDLALFENMPETNPEGQTVPHHTAYVLYTSGSTGMPKGVVVSHQSLVNYTHFIGRRLRLYDTPRAGGPHFATVSTITADLGNTCIFPSLVSGGCLHILNYEVATDSARFAQYMAEHPIDVLKIVPSHLNALLASQPSGLTILPRQYLILGGEALPFVLIDQIAQSPNGCEVINHYGPTEATVGCLIFDVNACRGGQGPPATVPMGRPIANTEVYILDSSMQPVPIGVPGELYIGGVGLAQGYLNQAERTAERFVPHPFSSESGARLYQTGDVVRYLPDGEVEFVGRRDHQVKIRGFRVELEEIEVVLGRHPLVRQAVVLAREGESGHQRLVAYAVPREAQTLRVSELQSYLEDELPEYMVPSVFVLLDTLPLTPNGKVDRQALPAPDHAQHSLENSYVAPRTPTEKLLADIWAQVLGCEKVGLHDNFFADLGGDSIISIQIIARANQAGLRLAPKQMFEYQTVAALAAVAGHAVAVEAEQGLVTGPLPLTPIQHWFFEQDVTDPHHWNQAVLFDVRQGLDPVLLDQVVHHLLVHHSTLR